jgi:cytochrome c-type biogenesis protein CcmH
MSGEDRQDMIRGMVARLSDRLATDGGTPQEWARLINALGVLGDLDQARAIYANAQQVFADTPDSMAPITAAAQQVGIAE